MYNRTYKYLYVLPINWLQQMNIYIFNRGVLKQTAHPN